MKSEIRTLDTKPRKAIEIWFDGTYLGKIEGADGRGVRIITPYEFWVGTISATPERNTVEILIKECG